MDEIVRKIRPFSNGTQYMDWEASNCGRCKKAATEEQLYNGDIPCDIEKEVAYAACDDGTITEEIAERMAFTRRKYVWQCGEWDPTEEWKARVRAVKNDGGF